MWRKRRKEGRRVHSKVERSASKLPGQRRWARCGGTCHRLQYWRSWSKWIKSSRLSWAIQGEPVTKKPTATNKTGQQSMTTPSVLSVLEVRCSNPGLFSIFPASGGWFLFLDLFILCYVIWWFCLHKCMYTTCMPYTAGEISRGHWIPGTRVVANFEAGGYWDLNPDPLREQVFLATKPSLQPGLVVLFKADLFVLFGFSVSSSSCC